MSETLEVSRRTFLKVGTVTALSAGTSTESEPAAAIAESTDRAGASRFDQPGSPSRKAERAWAEEEYTHYQRMRDPDDLAQQGSPSEPQFSQTKNAVKDLGADPNGNRPISEDINSSDLADGTLIVFPPGTYLVTGTWNLSGGQVGIAGKGYQNASRPPKPGKNTATFVAESGTRARITFTATTGLFANLVLDQRRSNNSIGLVIETDGFNQAQNVRFVGTQDNTDSPADESQEVPHCALTATSADATARAERVVGRGVGLPGTKESGGSMFFWVGDGNKGTAQMGNCTVTNTADNALYGSRTPGNAQVKGGTFHNNAVSQLRISGKGSWIDGATITIDAENYQGPTNGTGYNEKYGTNGVKVERGDKDYGKASGVVIRNTDLRCLSVGSQGMGALVLVRGSGGAVKLENDRLVNEVEGQSVTAEPPGGGYSGATAPPPHNITITHSLFSGSNAEVMVSERPNSLVSKTCFKLSDASSEIVSGMRIGQAVSFGKKCKGKAGLKNPKKVGSPGKLPPVPELPGGPGGPPGSGPTSTPSRPKALVRGSGGGSFFAAIFGGFLGGIGLLLFMMVFVPFAFLVILWQILGD